MVSACQAADASSRRWRDGPTRMALAPVLKSMRIRSGASKA
jgi:hypothetical protein